MRGARQNSRAQRQGENRLLRCRCSPLPGTIARSTRRLANLPGHVHGFERPLALALPWAHAAQSGSQSATSAASPAGSPQGPGYSVPAERTADASQYSTVSRVDERRQPARRRLQPGDNAESLRRGMTSGLHRAGPRDTATAMTQPVLTRADPRRGPDAYCQ